jgi:cell division protein FtsL
MKGSSVFLFSVMAIVIIWLGYYNFEQQNTIDLLNEEILDQARRRHNLILEKHVLEQKNEELMEVDSLQVNL